MEYDTEKAEDTKSKYKKSQLHNKIRWKIFIEMKSKLKNRIVL